MKPRYLVSVLVLFLCESLSGQTHHYQYSHDTLGNRVSRVYQGTVPTKGNGMDPGRIDPADTTVAQMAGILVDDSSYAGELQTRHYTEKDTIKVSPLGTLTANIPGKAWAGMVNKGITGFASGFTTSAVMNGANQLISTGKVDLDNILHEAWRSGLSGLALGSIVGTAEGIKAARKAGENPWALTEEDLCSQQSSLPLKSFGAKAKASRLHTESKPTTAQELGIEKEVERIKMGLDISMHTILLLIITAKLYSPQILPIKNIILHQ